jgi:E3 ubiquitin-protein ligase MARCH6
VHRPAGRKETIFWRILDIPFQAVFGKYDPAATFARVPAHDRVILLAVKKNGTPKRVGMFVRLNRNGQPKTADDKIKMIRQDLLARRAERDPATDFRITHLPQFWRTRIHIFILVLLAGAGVALATFILGPVILGRELLKGYLGEVHDGYSFVSSAFPAKIYELTK